MLRLSVGWVTNSCSDARLVITSYSIHYTKLYDGSTAVQLVPPIAGQAARLHVFQRTANWVLPRFERRYRGIDRLLASYNFV